MTGLALLFISSLFLAVTAVQQSYVKVSGVVSSHANKESTARSKLDCVISSCSGPARCIVSFHSRSGLCIASPLPRLLPLSWLKQCGLLTVTLDPLWSSYISNMPEATWERPSGLWLMDSAFRGCNLGAKGRQLDSSDVGVGWSSVGPRGETWGLKYARLNKTSQPVIQVLHGGTYLLNFIQPFTVMLWLRNDDVDDQLVILDGRYDPAPIKFATRFWFFNSRNQDMLLFCRDYCTYTTKNAMGRLWWRHVAFVFEGGQNFKVYQNGTLLPVFKFRKDNNPSEVKQLHVGFHHQNYPNYNFRGAMACISMFEKPLDVNEIRAIMNECP